MRTLLLLLAMLPCTASAHWTSGRPDGHAPIGVMGDHTHHRGDFMLSYRFMVMNMDGSRDGNSSIAATEVVSPTGSNFRVTPTRMPMQMHMFGLMAALSDKLTLMGMMSVTSMEMEHLTRMGAEFKTASSGIGDTKLTALYVLKRFGNQQIHLNAGVSLPTGSIKEKDVTPASAPNETQLPYPMQLGSGTIDLQPGVTYLGQTGKWSWGSQVRATLRVGENDHHYRLGNRFLATVWGARVLSQWLSVSARAEAITWGNIHGADPAYAMAVQMRMVPTVFTDLRGGSRLDGGLGINFIVPSGSLRGFRLAIEGLLPVYQDLDGPQLETDWSIVAGMQYAF